MLLRSIYIFNDLVLLLYILTKGQIIKKKLKIKISNYPSKNKIIVMGNGPSLKKDIHEVEKNRKDTILYSVNNFPLTDYFLKLKPNMFVFMDPVYWTDNVNAKLKAQKIQLYQILRGVDWPMTVICPRWGAKYVRHQLEENPMISIEVITPMYLRLNSENLSVWALKNNFITPNFVDVVILALWHALHQSQNYIELYGVDSTSYRELEVDQLTNKVFKRSAHFYAQSSGEEADAENYPGQKSKKLHQRMYQTWTKFWNIYLLSIVAARWKKKIKNLSSYSVIDNFVRE